MPTTIELRDNQACLLIDEEGAVEFHVPEFDNDVGVPVYALFITALAMQTIKYGRKFAESHVEWLISELDAMPDDDEEATDVSTAAAH